MGTLFSARAGGDWFFMVRPATILLCGAMFAMSCSTLCASFWPKSTPDHIQTQGLLVGGGHDLFAFVWAWSMAWWFVEDAAKVFCRWFVHKNNIFGINDSGEMYLSPSAKKLQDEMRIQAELASSSTGGHH